MTPVPPRAWRVLPLLAGLAVLGFFVVHGKPASPAGQILVFVPGFALIMTGLVIAGPWLTMAGARVLARRANRPGALIAARRLADDPRAAFRAVSGLVLALFIITVAATLIATQNTKPPFVADGAAANNILIDQFSNITQVSSGQQFTVGSAPPPSAAVLTRLRQISGVRAIVEVRADPGLTHHQLAAADPGLPGRGGVVRPARERPWPRPLPGGGGSGQGPRLPHQHRRRQPGAGSPGRPRISPPGGWTASRWAAWTWRRTGRSPRSSRPGRYWRTPTRPAPARRRRKRSGESTAAGNAADNAYQQLADVVILTSLTIAGCTLATGMAGGLADRKRPFSLLRLTGARLGMLRRVIALESAVPLLAVAAVAIGTGFGASAMYATMRDEALPGGAGRRLLRPDRGRDRAGPRPHRGHVPAAAAHHRPGDRQKRVIR